MHKTLSSKAVVYILSLGLFAGCGVAEENVAHDESTLQGNTKSISAEKNLAKIDWKKRRNTYVLIAKKGRTIGNLLKKGNVDAAAELFIKMPEIVATSDAMLLGAAIGITLRAKSTNLASFNQKLASYVLQADLERLAASYGPDNLFGRLGTT